MRPRAVRLGADRERRGEILEPGEDKTGEELLQRIAEIARELSSVHSLDETVQRVVDIGQRYLEECDGASLMFIRRGGEITSPAASSEIAYQSDMAQYEADDGPCLRAIRDHEVIIIDDLETDDRWPDYRALALKLGVRSMISFRLFAEQDTMGALNLYSKRPNAFDRRSKIVGSVFASHASVALKAAITEAGLEQALQSRDTIGQAKGILMEREGLTPDAAFARLRRLSQHHNVPVRELAERITTTGEVPGG